MIVVDNQHHYETNYNEEFFKFCCEAKSFFSLLSLMYSWIHKMCYTWCFIRMLSNYSTEKNFLSPWRSGTQKVFLSRVVWEHTYKTSYIYQATTFNYMLYLFADDGRFFSGVKMEFGGQDNAITANEFDKFKLSSQLRTLRHNHYWLDGRFIK